MVEMAGGGGSGGVILEGIVVVMVEVRGMGS